MYVPYATVNQDQPQPKASNLGIASLTLGLISLLGSWVPCCGIGAYPVATVGLILGVVGLLVSISNHGSKAPLGFQIAGIIVCIISFFMPFLLPLILIGGAATAPTVINQTAVRPISPAAPLNPPPPLSFSPSPALIAARKQLETAKADCIARLKITDAYSAAGVDAQNKLNHLNDTKISGDQDEIPKASMAYIQAKSILAKMEDDACAHDPAVISAQKELDGLSR